jgi:hypothetical protein
MTDIVARLREWTAADMDTHASLRRHGKQVAVVPWSRHGTDLAETVLEAAAEIERLRAAQAWQPIETAPKNQRVLVWDGQDVIGATFGGVRWWSADDETRISPTHWRPLPEAPTP